MNTSESINELAAALAAAQGANYITNLWPYPYAITETGEIFSFHKKTPRKIRGGRAGQMGYWSVFLYDVNGGYRRAYVHRLIAETFIGPIPNGMEVRHLDGNVDNNHFSNIAIGTAQENHADKVRHDTVCNGVKNPMAVLDDAQVIAIRAAHADGVAQRQLARDYSVSPMTINRIVNKKLWRHL